MNEWETKIFSLSNIYIYYVHNKPWNQCFLMSIHFLLFCNAEFGLSEQVLTVVLALAGHRDRHPTNSCARPGSRTGRAWWAPHLRRL